MSIPALRNRPVEAPGPHSEQGERLGGQFKAVSEELATLRHSIDDRISLLESELDYLRGLAAQAADMIQAGAKSMPPPRGSSTAEVAPPAPAPLDDVG